MTNPASASNVARAIAAMKKMNEGGIGTKFVSRRIKKQRTTPMIDGNNASVENIARKYDPS